MKEHVIVAETPEGKHIVRCGRCNRLSEIERGSVTARTSRKSGCLLCRDTSKTVVHCGDCGRRFQTSRNRVLTVGAQGIDVRCECCQFEYARARDLRIRKKRVRKALGRVCESCGANDSEVLWTQYLSRCAACDRRGLRNGWCSCGRAKFKTKECACS